MLLNLTGIFSELLFVILILLCYQREKTFNFKKNPFSYFGGKQKTKKLFNSGLLIILIIRIIFIVQIFNMFSFWRNSLIVIFSIVAFLGGMLAAIFSTDSHNKIHNLSAKLSAVFSFIFILIIGIYFIKADFNLGLINIIIATLIFFLITYLIKVKKVTSIFEIMFLILIIIWDNVMTLKLFNII